MLARVDTCVVRGVEALPIRVEVNLSSGLPAFTIVGLAQGSVREGRERVAAALRNSGYGLPNRKITVNLAPADIRKGGTAFDLPIAMGVLVASGVVPADAVADSLFLGELGLDGSLRPVAGVLPAAILAREQGARRLIVPVENAAEAQLIQDLELFAAACLGEVVDVLNGREPSEPSSRTRAVRRPRDGDAPMSGRLDLSDVRGQSTARRALEIVAAGGHNLLLVGPPGVGKTMLARRLPSIMPPLEPEEALEVARVHSVAGLLARGEGLPKRPFRAPHHSVSYAGLAGGGSPLRPGEISLAHRGVLFLDELPEYRRDVLEVLRQPMEEGWVRLARAGGAVRFPAQFLLVASMNPCPCGFLGDGSDRCRCDDVTIARYRGRVSGPLLDRIDMTVETAMPVVDRFHGVGNESESSAAIAVRVKRARGVQSDRLRHAPGVFTNAQLTTEQMRSWCRPTDPAIRMLRSWAEREGTSARGYDRALKVARTIADLDGRTQIDAVHVGEALQYRLGTPR